MGVTSNPTTMKELCDYSANQRKLRGNEHRRKHYHHTMHSGLTDSEWLRVKTGQKSTFSKSRKFTHNKMWRDTHKKFDNKQLILIRKTL